MAKPARSQSYSVASGMRKSRSGKISPDVSESSMDGRLVDEAVEGIRAGRPVVLPTDTVYGLCTTPYHPEPVRGMYRLKGRDEQQPTALLSSDLDMIFECLPELRGRAERLVRGLLPGQLTLVLPNPARRFSWLT